MNIPELHTTSSNLVRQLIIVLHQVVIIAFDIFLIENYNKIVGKQYLVWL